MVSDLETIPSPSITVEMAATESDRETAHSSIEETRTAGVESVLDDTLSSVSSLPPSPVTASIGDGGPPKNQSSDEAKQRSLRSRYLQAIRTHQQDEQSEFLEYHFRRLQQTRDKYAELGKAAEEDCQKDQIAAEQRFVEQHQEMEERHLTQEIELRRALELESQACNTRLKYMEAYCNGPQIYEQEGRPRRNVTEADKRKLVHQYHIRETMDNLHEAKINVLRKKQARQLERLTESQGEQLDLMRERFDTAEKIRQDAQNTEDENLRIDFEAKKLRLNWRWKVMETVERYKLERESGEAYGELPDVQWSEEEWLRQAL